jgi:hypothetical protein
MIESALGAILTELTIYHVLVLACSFCPSVYYSSSVFLIPVGYFSWPFFSFFFFRAVRLVRVSLVSSVSSLHGGTGYAPLHLLGLQCESKQHNQQSRRSGNGKKVPT